MFGDTTQSLARILWQLSPGLALLLAGPALSLPNMLVIRSVMGTKKTIAFVSLVVIMATFSGMIFGYIST